MHVKEDLSGVLAQTLYHVEQAGLSNALEEELYRLAKDELDEFLFYLISYRHYFPFLERLFSVKAGEWLDLESICDDYEHITTRLQRLRRAKALRAPVDVTWLDYSHCSDGEGYCLIVFYCRTPLWSTNIIYNKRYILQIMNKIKQTSAPKKNVFLEDELEIWRNVAEEGLTDVLEEALYHVAKEELNERSSDLVTHQRYFPSLERLFSVNPGEWLDVESLCDFDEEATKQFQKLRRIKAVRAPVDVTWVEYFDSSDAAEYCLIVFYCQAPLWSHNIIYNKTYFTEKMAEMKSNKTENKAVFS